MLFTSDYQNHTTRLQTYLHLVANHQDPVSAAATAFGDLDKLDRDLDRYVTQNSWLALKEKTSFHQDPKSFAVRVLPASDVDASRADIIVNNGRFAEAKALAGSALKANPRNALAHEVMGAIALHDQDQAEARKWFGAAVELDPDSQRANFRFAALALMAGEKDNPSIETSLRRCIASEPTFAPAYDALAQYFIMVNRNLDEAHLLTLKAVQLDPSVLSFRLNAAQILTRQSNIPAALAVLREAQKHTTTPEEAEQVRSRIEQLTRQQAERCGALRTTTGAVLCQAPTPGELKASLLK
jgi:tetratricopeptide (TPR) repeat protein